jgi:hypothetical protein
LDNPVTLDEHSTKMISLIRRAWFRWLGILSCVGFVCFLVATWAGQPAGLVGRQDSDGVYDYLVSILRTPRPDVKGSAEPIRIPIEYDSVGIIDDLPLLPPEYGEYLPYLTLPPALTSSRSHPALARALHAFLSRPVLSHAEYTSQDHAEWTAQCPRDVTDRTSTVGVTFDNHDWWYTVGKNMIREERVGLVKRLDELIESGVSVTMQVKDREKTRGLVMTGGNKVRRSARCPPFV